MNNTLIIGMGSIGGLKPDKFDSSNTENILTHAHCVSVHPEFRLYGVMDIDKDKVIKAVEKWHCMGFTDTSKVNEDDVDVVVIASPTETHLDIYNQIKSWDLKAIILEKPAGNSLSECKDMRGDKRIIVNYTRQFLPLYQGFAFLLKSMNVLSCVINYVRGLKRDGCHSIDLCRYFFGEIVDVKKLSTGPADYSLRDTTDCVWMRAERCPNILMVPGDGRIADFFDFQIMTEKGMYNLYDHGTNIYSREIEQEKVYGNYNSLSGEQKLITSLNFGKHGLMSLYDYVNEVIQCHINNLCTIEDALQVHEIMEEIRNG